MKQEKNIETKAESQNGQGIQDALTGMYQTISWAQPKSIVPPVTPSTHLRSGKGGGFCIGKAPPGSARSPGAARGHPPENKAGPPDQADPAPSPLSFGREGPGVSQKNKNIYNNENQYFINKTNFNFLLIFNFFNHLIFKIMKKQILILALLVMATFASVNRSYGQEKPTPPALATVPTCIVPTPLGALCSGNPLTPLVGVPYTYEVNVPALDAGTKSYNWFVTTSVDFIKKDAITLASSITATIDAIGGSHILAVSPKTAIGTSNFGSYNNLDVSAPVDGTLDGNFKIEISWKYWVHDPEAPVFLVIYVKNDATCDNDNLKVYIIKPTHSFTLDIANILTSGLPGKLASDPAWAIEDGPCAAPVSTASWIAPSTGKPDGEIVMEYGVNYLYYMVTAANFNNSWLPKFRVSGTGIGDVATRERVVTAIDWQYVATSNVAATLWNATKVTYDFTTPGSEFYAGTGAGAAAGADLPVVALDTKFGGVTGECIIVRVTVANHRIETLTVAPITLAVDGRMYDEAAVTAAAGAPAKALAAYANASLDDIHYTVGPATEPCPYIDGFVYDKVAQNIMPRPDVQSKTAPSDVPFIPAKAN